MSWFSIAIWFFRLIGFIQWAENLEQKIQEKQKAKDTANAPETLNEELGWFDKSK